MRPVLTASAGRWDAPGWPDFADSEYPLLLARMGRMWGRLPHELLLLSPQDFGINVAALQAWDAHVAQQLRSSKPMAVVDLGGL